MSKCHVMSLYGLPAVSEQETDNKVEYNLKQTTTEANRGPINLVTLLLMSNLFVMAVRENFLSTGGNLRWEPTSEWVRQR